MEGKKAHLLIAILDWGWGHAMRCTPIIEVAIKKGYRVTVASGRAVIDCLSEYHPEVHTLELPTYEGQFRWNNMAMNIAMKTPNLIAALEAEHASIKKYYNKNKFDAIISDGRYGCYHDECPSFYLSHQIHIKARKKLTDTMADEVHREWLSNFTEIWIPDFETEPGLGNQISHSSTNLQHFFLGPLSRFDQPAPAPEEIEYDWLFLTYGPEPARTNFEDRLIEISKKYSDHKFMFVSPKSPSTALKNHPNLMHCFQPKGKTLDSIVAKSKYILCRSDFFHLSDLCAWQRTAALIPTPGHPEQIYLADLFGHHYKWPVFMQSEFTDLPESSTMDQLENLPAPDQGSKLKMLFRRLGHNGL